ncbi:uncharacterized protein DUF4399 [Azospirillum brasilense]|uniref:DUF4399 domain-containing protein n=1 Tax=Azospirillum baldaniorum TaxID=1064539 RepID=A0A9P1JRG9_9PROT|nr:DUF4399 domain-containing protein [Azospirillum baldaniorum]TWA72122.1 uncharacterized protein DUF4399 [Azospirillum baldaniorum]TWA76661.1 uncharacterized protein DUF4399 [Azospirillum brasilense]CCC98354.1 conserved exported protein of unknown function [Azospirillum baldaniorum]
MMRTAAVPVLLAVLLAAGPLAAQSSPEADPLDKPLSDTTNTPQPASPGHEHESTPSTPDAAKSGRTAAPKDVYIYVGWPNDGEVVRGRFKVWFGLRNFGVAPAGVRKDNTGHHHLLVDTDLPPMDEPIPNNRNYIHFGKGQTETYLELPPGRHTLQLLMGDAEHIPHDPPILSKKITITVRPGGDSTRVSVR